MMQDQAGDEQKLLTLLALDLNFSNQVVCVAADASTFETTGGLIQISFLGDFPCAFPNWYYIRSSPHCENNDLDLFIL